MADSDFAIETVDNTGPPPWFHEPQEWLAGTVETVELTDHDKFGPGFRFIFHIDGDDLGDGVWYTTGRTKSNKNKLGRLGTAIFGTLDAVPGDVREFIGLGIYVMFEHIPPAKEDEHWQERITAVKGREITEEEAEMRLKHELKAEMEAPF